MFPQLALLSLALCWAPSTSEDKKASPEITFGDAPVNGTAIDPIEGVNGTDIDDIQGGNGTGNGTEERGILLGLLKGLHGGHG